MVTKMISKFTKIAFISFIPLAVGFFVIVYGQHESNRFTTLLGSVVFLLSFATCAISVIISFVILVCKAFRKT